MSKDITTIQVPTTLRDTIRAKAVKRAKRMGINKLSMVDYLALLTAEDR